MATLNPADPTSEPSAPQPYLPVEPYPLYTGEPLGDLRGFSASQFPSAATYPPPTGNKESKTRCGCLYTDWGDVRLETIWQPWWDFRPVTQGQGELHFFQNPSPEKQRKGQCNPYATARGFTWPKRYHMWEIAFHLSENPEWGSNAFERFNLKNAQVIVQIGEKVHLQAPLEVFHPRETFNPPGASPSRRTERIFLPLPLPLYIPTVQHYSVYIRWNASGQSSDLARADGSIRCVLGGYLSREIP